MSTLALRQRFGKPDGPETAPYSATGVIGTSEALRRAVDLSNRAARSDAPVFLAGESGTGKEVFAQFIHRHSRRATGLFVPVNCAAIPHELIESELFGHVKGAFTGAISDYRGAALRANGGTLFFDEVCEMPLTSQAKLLRFLQTGDVQRVGSGQLEKSDVRIICATNLDPEIEVKKGRFRQDLFHRLFVLPVPLPRLADRGQDILQLADYFLKCFCDQEARESMAFSPEAETYLLSYGWPGNVRELQNVVRRIVVFNDGPVAGREMLPSEIAGEPSSPSLIAESNVIPLRPNACTLSDIEREAVTSAIAFHEGSIPKAAKTLGVSPSTIYRKLGAWSAAGKR